MSVVALVKVLQLQKMHKGVEVKDGRESEKSGIRVNDGRREVWDEKALLQIDLSPPVSLKPLVIAITNGS